MAKPLDVKRYPAGHPGLQSNPEPLKEHADHFEKLAARDAKIRDLMAKEGLTWPQAEKIVDAPAGKPLVVPKA